GFGIVLAVVVVGGSLIACGSPTAKFPAVTATEMPAGETWQGVYYNQVYGYLHLVTEGENIVGRWKRSDSSHWGELSGRVDGNVFRFTWTEHRYGAIGPSGDSHGSGQFVYTKAAEQKAIPELKGKYALD